MHATADVKCQLEGQRGAEEETDKRTKFDIHALLAVTKAKKESKNRHKRETARERRKKSGAAAIGAGRRAMTNKLSLFSNRRANKRASEAERRRERVFRAYMHIITNNDEGDDDDDHHLISFFPSFFLALCLIDCQLE